MTARDASPLPGLGPKTTAWLREVGIDGIDDLRQVGAVAAYCRLKQWNPRQVTRNALWGLYAAVHNIPWQQVDDATKKRLLAEVDAGDSTGGEGRL